MVNSGVVGQEILCVLLERLVEASNVRLLIRLMLKYGLIVRLEHRASSGLPDDYFVPARMPVAAPTLYEREWKDVLHHNSCYFVFFTHKESMLSCLCPSYLKTECFLPQGLMERVLGRVSNDGAEINRNFAVLSYGRTKFRLVSIPDLNCIRLDVEGEHPLPVYSHVREQIITCVNEFMHSLKFIAALSLGAASDAQDEFVLLNFEALSRVQSSGRSLFVKGFGTLDRAYVNNNYGSWIRNELNEMEYEASLRESYIPEPVREDWEWFSNSYAKNEINQKYYQKFALLHKKQLSETAFNSEKEAFNYLSLHKGCGVVVHVGPKYDCTDILMATTVRENRFTVSSY